MLLSFWPATRSGDTDAARIVLRTLDGLAKLYGLNAPTRVAAGLPVSAVEFAEEAARLIDSIASMGATDDLLRSLPGGAGQAVFDARSPAANTSSGQRQPSSGAHSAESVPDDEEWSNFGPDPVPAVPPSQPISVPEPEPQPVQSLPSYASRVSRRITDRYDPLAGWQRYG